MLARLQASRTIEAAVAIAQQESSDPPWRDDSYATIAIA